MESIDWIKLSAAMYSTSQNAGVFTLDGHADTVQRCLDEGWCFTDALGSGMLNLAAARTGHLNGQFFAIWVDPAEHSGRLAHETLRQIDAVHRQIERAPDQLQLCTNSLEVRAAHAAGRFAVLLGLEGGGSIENDLGLLRAYYRLGVRYMTLTWAHSVGWADSSGDLDDTSIEHVHGLTPFGCQVVEEMNRIGMLIDVSHVSDETFWAVLQQSRTPVIASHSSARALTRSARNLSDEQLRALGNAGGLAMVNFFPAFIDEAWRTAWNAQRPERDAAQQVAARPYREQGLPVPFAVSWHVDRAFALQLPSAPLSSLLDHVEHMIDVMGAEHVGLGSDFDGIPCLPDGLRSAADLPRIADGLRTRGISEQTIAAVFGANLMRVMDTVQQHAIR